MEPFSKESDNRNFASFLSKSGLEEIHHSFQDYNTATIPYLVQKGQEASLNSPGLEDSVKSIGRENLPRLIKGKSFISVPWRHSLEIFSTV